MSLTPVPQDDDREIGSLAEKFGELKETFSGLEMVIHIEDDDKCDEYTDPLETIEAVNPYKGENLYIELSDEFTLFWGSWHSHYFPGEADFGRMTEDIKRIIAGEMGAVSVYCGEDWLQSRLWQGIITYDSTVSELKKDDGIFNLLKLNCRHEDTVTVRAVYWQPENSVSIDIPCREFEREGHGHLNSRK